jgi:putative transposase
MSRTVNGERIFDDTSKEVLRKHLWNVADYCGIEVITYAVVENHFHVMVHVPQKAELSDAELLRRYEVLHPRPSPSRGARLEVIRKQLEANGEEAQKWRRRQQAMMGDLSPFMQLFKQGFSTWFNKSHNRFGTLWAARFKSVLVEGPGPLLQILSAYVDLNCVRANIRADPKDYRFCGYAEAVAGNPRARQGLSRVCREQDWEQVQAAYRQILFGAGSAPRREGATIDSEAFARVMAEGGKLALSEVLRCRVRYFTEGAVLGSKAFVESHLAAYRRRTGGGEKTLPRPLPNWGDWGELSVLPALRRPSTA